MCATRTRNTDGRRSVGGCDGLRFARARSTVPPWEYEPGTASASIQPARLDVPPWEYLPGEAPRAQGSAQSSGAGLVPPWEDLPNAPAAAAWGCR